MKKLLNNLFTGIVSKILPTISKAFLGLFSGLGSKILAWYKKLDWNDRILWFLAAICVIGGLVNLSLKTSITKLKTERQELKQELTLQRTFVTELQVLVKGQTAQTRRLRTSLDSVNIQAVSLVQDNAIWRQVTHDTQNIIKGLVQQRDSLRSARIVYKDRCFNAFGNEVDCAKRKNRK